MKLLKFYMSKNMALLMFNQYLEHIMKKKYFIIFINKRIYYK